MPVGALLLLAVTIAAGMAMQSVFSPIQETIKLDLGLSDFRMSLLQGVAASIPVALLALPFGRLIDRSNRIRLLVLLAVTWTAGTLLTVAAQSFLLLFVARTLAGIGAVLAIMVGISIAADLTEPARRGRALLLLSLGKNIGLASSFALGGWLFARLEQGPALFGLEPWRGVHLAFGLVAALLVLPLLLLREPARREVAEGVDIPVRTALAEVWERRSLLVPLFIGQVTVTMADVAALIWSAPVLERSYGLAPADFAGWMGLVVLLSGIGGSLAGGFAADAGHRSKVAGGILIGAVAAATLSIPGAFFAVMPSVTGFALMLALLLLCGGVTGLVTATAIAVLVPNEIRGLCLGAFMVVGAIIGYGVAPTLVTLVSQLLGGEDQIRYALVGSGALTSLVAALGFVRAMRSASVRSI
jgi:MFS family permease